MFDAGWREFSDREYFQTEGRRFLLGTLVRYGGSGLQTLEFDRADVITGAADAAGLLRGGGRAPARPGRLGACGPRARQVQALQGRRGHAAAGRRRTPRSAASRLQPMTPGVGFGVLRFVPAAELAPTPAWARTSS